MPYARKRAARPRKRTVRKRATGITAKVTVRKKVPVASARALQAVSRKLERVRMMTYGSIQRNFVIANRTISPTDARPFMFDVNNLFFQPPLPVGPAGNGADVYQYNALGQLQNIANWVIPTVVQDNPFHEGANADTPGTGKYLLLSNSLIFRVEAGTTGISNRRVRIQVFSCKSSRFVPNLTTLPQDNMIMPAALNQLGYMCRPTAGNYLNKKYFHIHYDSGMRSMNSTKTNANLKGTTQNVMFMKYTWSPRGGKLINQRYTSPSIQHEDPAQPLAGGPDRVSIAQPRWLLFSSDDPASDTAQFNINISSVRRYRDHVGAEL